MEGGKREGGREEGWWEGRGMVGGKRMRYGGREESERWKEGKGSEGWRKGRKEGKGSEGGGWGDEL